MTKSDGEIVEILEAFDLTRCFESAAVLAGCDPKTVQRYVTIRDAGGNPFVSGRRPRLVDPFLEKIEEWVERSKGRIRADVVHDRIVPMGFGGDPRTTRRAVEEAKAAFESGRRRTYRPWVPEPGMWLQWDWGQGPVVRGRDTCLWCAWLAWSRFRVVLATWDRTLGTVLGCLDRTLRRIGGVPTYALTDNEKTVTVGHVAGIAVRHPQIVAAGRHYGLQVETCVPYDPETKGGSEATVKIAKADLVPTDTNLRDDYRSFAELVEACDDFSRKVNGRPHTETKRPPQQMLAEEQAHLHVLPDEPYTAALGETRLVYPDQTIRWGSVRYSTPPGHVDTRVWCRIDGDELVIVARTDGGLVEIARHERSTPGNPRIVDEHYPDHPGGNGPQPRPLRPHGELEVAFCALGAGAELWLREAAGSGAPRIRAKMTHAVELAAVIGVEGVDRALGVAAGAGRFADGDLAAIADHLAAGGDLSEAVTCTSEAHSAQPGTNAWGGFGR